jgi:iron complex outermembrane receptor protein
MFGSVIFVSVEALPSQAQAQAGSLPPVTVEAPTPPKTRSSTAASSQRTRSSRAISTSRRASAAPGQNSAPQAAAGATGAPIGYVATRSSAGTKTNTPLIETPQSLSVVTKKELEDRNVQTLKDAVNYTPGVTTSAFGYDPRFDSFYIRGFDATYTGIYRDGLRQGGGNFVIPKIEP